MIYLTGDTHGSVDISKLNSKNFPQGNNLTKNDYVIILGDFGFIWDNSKEDLYWRKWFLNKPWTTLFIDGNHENFDLLFDNELFPVIDKFNGKVSKINDSIFYLRRGEIYTIDDKNFYCFGGAESVDKHLRKESRSWWHQEIPTITEMNYGINNLEKINFNVDYVLTHTCSSNILPFVVNSGKVNGVLERHFNFLDSCLNDDCTWYFGHFHRDILNIKDKYNCLYRNIIEIK